MSEKLLNEEFSFISQKEIWGCRHCGDVYEGSNVKGTNDECPHCRLLHSKSFEEQFNN